MKILLTRLIFTPLLAFSFNPLYASGAHDHNHEHGHSHSHMKKELTKVQVQKVATKEIRILFQKNKIDGSWVDAKLLKIEKKRFQNQVEWVVSYKNDAIKDTNKKIIYIFVTIYGEVSGANYTGY